MPAPAGSTSTKPLTHASANSCRPLVVSALVKFDCFCWLCLSVLFGVYRFSLLSWQRSRFLKNCWPVPMSLCFGRNLFLAIWRPALSCFGRIGGSVLTVYYLRVAAVGRDI